MAMGDIWLTEAATPIQEPPAHTFSIIFEKPWHILAFDVKNLKQDTLVDAQRLVDALDKVDALEKRIAALEAAHG